MTFSIAARDPRNGWLGVATSSKALAAGKADLVDVATAVAETETAVQALVSVRDKVIASYQQILQMPI